MNKAFPKEKLQELVTLVDGQVYKASCVADQLNSYFEENRTGKAWGELVRRTMKLKGIKPGGDWSAADDKKKKRKKKDGPKVTHARKMTTEEIQEAVNIVNGSTSDAHRRAVELNRHFKIIKSPGAWRMAISDALKKRGFEVTSPITLVNRPLPGFDRSAITVKASEQEMKKLKEMREMIQHTKPIISDKAKESLLNTSRELAVYRAKRDAEIKASTDEEAKHRADERLVHAIKKATPVKPKEVVVQGGIDPDLYNVKVDPEVSNMLRKYLRANHTQLEEIKRKYPNVQVGTYTASDGINVLLRKALENEDIE